MVAVPESAREEGQGQGRIYGQGIYADHHTSFFFLTIMISKSMSKLILGEFKEHFNSTSNRCLLKSRVNNLMLMTPSGEG
jgi:hypothetical protein